MWQKRLLEEIRSIDEEQAPHGLYGLPQVMAVGGRFTRISSLLSGKDNRFNPVLRLGWTRDRWRTGLPLNFNPPGEGPVLMGVEDHAGTKVRHYGNSYQLDRVHGKKDLGDLGSLDSRLASLHKQTETAALLLVAHMPLSRHFEKLPGKTASETFLTRYVLRLDQLQWEDRQGRGFSTGLFLWSAQKS